VQRAPRRLIRSRKTRKQAARAIFERSGKPTVVARFMFRRLANRNDARSVPTTHSSRPAPTIVRRLAATHSTMPGLLDSNRAPRGTKTTRDCPPAVPLPIRRRTLPVRTPLTLRPIRSRPTTTTNTRFGTFRRLTRRLSGRLQTHAVRRERNMARRARGAPEIELHCPEAHSDCFDLRVFAHQRGNALALCLRGHEVAAVTYVST
jgi:hypothetical protein